MFTDWNAWSVPITMVPEVLNPFNAERVKIFVVSTGFLPYGSHKFLTVSGLLQDAKESGILKNVHTLVEGTSGSTGVALASMANSLGLHTVLVAPPDLPEGKRFPLVLTGAEIIPARKGMSAIATARQMGGGGWKSEGWQADGGYLNLDQYANPAGTNLHASITVPKILDQLGGLPSAVVTPIGTSGAILGLGRGFRKRGPVKVWGVLCSPGQEIPGCRDRNRMKEIRLPWEKSFDEVVEIPTRPSYLASLWFNWTTGLTPGPSSGFAYLGALKLIAQYAREGALDLLRGRDGMICVGVMFPDGSGPYGDRFMANLPAEYLYVSTAPKPWQFPGQLLW